MHIYSGMNETRTHDQRSGIMCLIYKNELHKNYDFTVIFDDSCKILLVLISVKSNLGNVFH